MSEGYNYYKDTSNLQRKKFSIQPSKNPSPILKNQVNKGFDRYVKDNKSYSLAAIETSHTMGGDQNPVEVSEAANKTQTHDSPSPDATMSPGVSPQNHMARQRTNP